MMGFRQDQGSWMILLGVLPSAVSNKLLGSMLNAVDPDWGWMWKL